MRAAVRFQVCLLLIAAGIVVLNLGLPREAAALSAREAIVIFEEHYTSGEYAGDIDVGAQRISLTDGARLWESGEKSANVSSSKCLERKIVAIPDGSGGAIIVFEAQIRSGENAGDCDILAQRIDRSGRMMWNNGEYSTAVASSQLLEKNPVVVPDGAGGAIVIFEQHFMTGEYAGDIDIGAQRISADGRLLWHDGEKSAIVSSGKYAERTPRAISDGAGGAIVVFEAYARSGEHVNDYEILAQRIDGRGEMMWNSGERSETIASSQLDEKNPAIVSDGRGGAIIVFEQHYRTGEYAGDIDIGAQRISADGRLLWQGGEKSATVSSGKYAEKNPRAIPDGMGGAIVVFEAVDRFEEPDYEILAQRIDSSGEMMWNNGERSSVVASSQLDEKNPAVVSDGRGGAIVVFEEYYRTGEYAGDSDIGAQHISGEGRLLWREGERSAVVSSGKYTEQTACAVADGNGGVVVIFEAAARTGEHTGDWEILAQRLDASGEMMWNAGEKSVLVAASGLVERNPVIILP